MLNMLFRKYYLFIGFQYVIQSYQGLASLFIFKLAGFTIKAKLFPAFLLILCLTLNIGDIPRALRGVIQQQSLPLYSDLGFPQSMSTTVGLGVQRQLNNCIFFPVLRQVFPPVLSSSELWLHGSQRLGWLVSGQLQ